MEQSIATLLVTYDYVRTRTCWRVVRVERVQADGTRVAERLPWQRDKRDFPSVAALERAWSDGTRDVVCQRRDLCSDLHHGLEGARYSTASANGALVYVVCGCGRQRQVSAAQWQAELGEG